MTFFLALFLFGCPAADDGGLPDGAAVHFVKPKDGATVGSPVKVKMGVEKMEVEPAGEIKAGRGHHHIIVDGGPIDAGTVVPADKTHIHYGKGQTETELELEPGKHTLTLQFADGHHASYGPQLSQTITITVEGKAKAKGKSKGDAGKAKGKGKADDAAGKAKGKGKGKGGKGR